METKSLVIFDIEPNVNNKRSIMTDIKKIVNIIENYSPELAAEEILRLFSVVGQSEQLKCFIAEEFAQCHNPKKNSECICCKHY